MWHRLELAIALGLEIVVMLKLEPVIFAGNKMNANAHSEKVCWKGSFNT